MALVALTCEPSIASSNTRSRGSQKEEQLVPRKRPAQVAKGFEAINA